MRILVLWFFALTFGFVLAVPVAWAQQSGQVIPSVGIVAYQVILRKSKAINNIRDQVSEYFKKIREEMSSYDKQFRTEQESIVSKQNILSPEALEAEKTSFEKRVSEAQSRINNRQKMAERANLEALQKVELKLTEIVTRFAQQRNYNLILDGSAVLIMDPKMDMSQAVLQTLDAELASVPVIFQ